MTGSCDVYILHSAALDRYYVGLSVQTTSRIEQHRAGRGVWTSRANDWEMVFVRRMPSVAGARALEKKIKARGAGRYLKSACDE